MKTTQIDPDTNVSEEELELYLPRPLPARTEVFISIASHTMVQLVFSRTSFLYRLVWVLHLSTPVLPVDCDAVFQSFSSHLFSHHQFIMPRVIRFAFLTL